MKGIDVSYWQGKIAWKKVKKSGVEFAILRVASGKNLDACFHYNYKQAKANGILVGVYLYTTAKTTAEIDRELSIAFNALVGYELELPFFWDMESTSLRNLSKEQLTNNMLYALQKIESKGYMAGVYSNPDWLTYVIDYKPFKDYPLWLACYTSEDRRKALWRGRVDMWQYAAEDVKGVKTKCDVDILYNESIITRIRKVHKIKVTNCLAAWIRTNPNSNSKAIGVALRGQEFVTTGQVVRMQNVDWLRIKSGSAYGWVAKKYTSEV